MRASRLLSMLILLQMRGRLSAQTLAREFEVSVRTIYRDVDELSAAGVPIYAESGRTGGFALDSKYRTQLTGLTPAESEALLLGGIGVAAADLGMGADATAAQLKMLASLPPDSGASAQRVAERFHVDPVGWYRRREQLTHLPTLASAVWGDRRIRVLYESWSGIGTRELDPLGLVLKGGFWYLVAAKKGELRTYRVSGIRQLDVLTAKSRRLSTFSLRRYWTEWTRDFELRLLAERADIKLSPQGLRILRDLSPAAAEAVDAKHQASTPEGWIRADIPIESVAYATRQLLLLGAEMEVLAPEELRVSIAREAQRVVDRYSPPERVTGRGKETR
jgi:predicted DNA-binding transcriptional regulator YafY